MLTAPGTAPGRAIEYARRGWPVFPCRPGSKEPATRHGFRDASTDPDQIWSWWRRHPDANLAIATGAPGPDVLDVDKHGPATSGFAAYRQLDAAGMLDSAIAMVATPHGGLHVYFTGTEQASSRLPRHFLDFKAAGGYVLAPPSRVGDRPYRVLVESAGAGFLDWADVTNLLEPQRERLIRRHVATITDPARLAAWVARLEEGNRNCGLFWAACRAIEDGNADILGELAVAAAGTGLSCQEISRTIASARRTARSVAVHPSRAGD